MATRRTPEPVTITVAGENYTTKWICDEIEDALGAVPGHATFRAPGVAFDDYGGISGAAAGDTVVVTLDAATIFRGHISRIEPQIDSREGVIFTALDHRWKMSRRCIGDAEAGGWAQHGPFVVFNEGGRPNRGAEFNVAAVESATNRAFNHYGGTGVSYWTIGDVAEYVLRNYTDSDTVTLGADPSGLSAVGLDGQTAGEIDLIGTPIPQALDFLMENASAGDTTSASGNTVVTWRLNQATATPTFTLVQVGAGTARSLEMSNGQLDPADIDVLRMDAVHDHSQIANHLTAVGARFIVETCYSTEGGEATDKWTTNGWHESGTTAGDWYWRYAGGATGVIQWPRLIEDTEHKMPGFRRFVPDVENYPEWFYSMGGTGSGALPWEPLLVTRYGGSANHDYPNLFIQPTDYSGEGQELAPEEAIWISVAGVTTGNTEAEPALHPQCNGWRRVSSGIRIEYNPPAIYLDPVVEVYKDDGSAVEVPIWESNGVTTDAHTAWPPNSAHLTGLDTGSTGSAAPEPLALQLRATVATRIDAAYNVTPGADTTDLPWSVRRIVMREDMITLGRRRTVVPWPKTATVENVGINTMATAAWPGENGDETGWAWFNDVVGWYGYSSVSVAGVAYAEQERQERADKVVKFTLRYGDTTIMPGDQITEIVGGRAYAIDNTVVRKKWVLGDNGYVTELYTLPRWSFGAREMASAREMINAPDLSSVPKRQSIIAGAIGGRDALD